MKDRFKVFRGYKFDKWIFRSCLIVIIISLVAVVLINGIKARYYYECKSPTGCHLENIKPFCVEPSKLDEFKYPGRYEWLQSCGLCASENVNYGFKCGEPTGKFQGSEWFITLIFIFGALIYNHIKYNKDFEFGGLE